MKVKGNLLFSNQSFADCEEIEAVVINIDTIADISGCSIIDGVNTGRKTRITFNDNTNLIIEEDIEDVAMELWSNYGRED